MLRGNLNLYRLNIHGHNNSSISNCLLPTPFVMGLLSRWVSDLRPFALPCAFRSELPVNTAADKNSRCHSSY
jgi:hypothetical protein